MKYGNVLHIESYFGGSLLTVISNSVVAAILVISKNSEGNNSSFLYENYSKLTVFSLIDSFILKEENHNGQGSHLRCQGAE